MKNWIKGSIIGGLLGLILAIIIKGSQTCPIDSVTGMITACAISPKMLLTIWLIGLIIGAVIGAIIGSMIKGGRRRK